MNIHYDFKGIPADIVERHHLGPEKYKEEEF